MQSMRIPEPHNAEGAMHLSDTALGAVFDPAGGGASGCDWMVPPPGRLDGGRLIGAGSGWAGG